MQEAMGSRSSAFAANRPAARTRPDLSVEARAHSPGYPTGGPPTDIIGPRDNRSSDGGEGPAFLCRRQAGAAGNVPAASSRIAADG